MTSHRVFTKLGNERDMEIGPDGGAGAGIGAKKQRVNEQGDGREVVEGADAIPVDHISALPDDLRQRILTHVPLKDAIRTGALARGWRDLWKRRWAHRGTVDLHLRSRDDPRRELDALEQQPLPRPRMDRLSLVAETSSSLKSTELRRFIRHAAECRVEDLHVETRKGSSKNNKLNFHLPLLSSPLLARLSLRSVGISNMYYKEAQPFRALEVLRLYSVAIKAGFTRMMELCPGLLTLDLRGCDIHCDTGKYLFAPATVRSVTIADCGGYSRLWLMNARKLRSFRFSGDELFYLPRDAAVLADLYIRSAYRPVVNVHTIHGFELGFPKDFPDLNVLTICCNALRVASSSLPGAQLPNRNFHSLRELQLLMLEMEAINLADLYLFFKACRCPNLERLFVQLPTGSHEPMEEGPIEEVSIEEVREEPPQDDFGNLVMVKVMNFNWSPTEVQLVSFLLRKASSMRKLLIVSPNVTPLELPGVQEADLLLLNEALANGKMMMSESDDAATQPYHSEAFIKF